MTDLTLRNGTRVHLIGDPHLGLNFDKHAPAHRKGDRAIRHMAHFNDELYVDTDINVMVGDLFDDPYVPRQVIVSAAQAYLSAAEAKPDTLFVAQAGNHDVPRNLAAVGAWTMFTRMVEERLPNLIVLRRPAIFLGIAFFPWEWDRTAEEQVADLAGKYAEVAVGHWDLEEFDGPSPHMAPVELLQKTFGNEVQLVSGHFHKPGWYGGVLCTGSLEPVSHGEDPDELFYVTRSLADVLANADAYRDKHVRVIVKPGEEIPEIDCLGVTHLRVRDDNEAQAATVSPANFDWTRRLSDRIQKLAPPVRDFIIERMPDVAPEKQHRGGPETVLRSAEQGASGSADV